VPLGSVLAVMAVLPPSHNTANIASNVTTERRRDDLT